MTALASILKGSAERAEYGCIVTFENAARQRLVLARVGPPMKALKIACDDAREADSTFRIVSYSSPETVYRDLVGRTTGESDSRSILSVEVQVATRAGLREMLHERLIRLAEGRLEDRKLRRARSLWPLSERGNADGAAVTPTTPRSASGHDKP